MNKCIVFTKKDRVYLDRYAEITFDGGKLNPEFAPLECHAIEL